MGQHADRVTPGDQTAARANARAHRVLLRTLPHGVQEITPTGVILYANEAAHTLYGYASGELIGKTVYDLAASKYERNRLRKYLAAMRRTRGTPKPFRGKSLRKDGQTLDVQVDWSYREDDSGQLAGFIAVITNITEQTRAREDIAVAHRFLKVANRHASMKPLLEAFLAETLALTGCEAVGIRILDANGNIPYQAWRGFPQAFHESENMLSIQTDQCMCISVLLGRTDPGLPFYTPGGSFYMNHTTRFLASVSEADKGRTRNVCNEFGYESVALIPIRMGDAVLGLIHLADHRENQVPLSLVMTLERVALQLGIAVQRVTAEEALRAAHAELEQRVETRTAQLARANQRLHEEIEVRRRAEESLKRSSELLERVFSSVHILLAYMDTEFTFIRVNSTYAKADGHSPEFFVGKRHFDLYPNADNERIFREVVQTGNPYFVYEKPFEYAEHPDRGTTYWDWSLQPVKDTDGRVDAVVLSLVNVTDRKRAQQALMESEQNFRALAENANDGIMIAAGEGIITYANHPAADLLGCRNEDLVGSRIEERVHPQDVTRVVENYQKRMGGEAVEDRYEITMLGQNDAATTVDITVGRTVWKGQNAAIAILRDMSEVKQLQKEILKISAREHQRIGEDLHDVLGQHLTGIAFLAKALQQKLAAQSLPEAENAAKITELVNQATHQTRQLAQGICPVDVQPEGLMTALRRFAANVQTLFGVTCRFLCDRAALVHDGTTATHLYHIAQEAVTNAIRHGEARRIMIRLTTSNGRIQLAIKDDGVGLPKGRGVRPGMGLRIMRHRATMIGATLDVTSLRGSGTLVICSMDNPNREGRR